MYVAGLDQVPVGAHQQEIYVVAFDAATGSELWESVSSGAVFGKTRCADLVASADGERVFLYGVGSTWTAVRTSSLPRSSHTAPCCTPATTAG